MAEVRKSSTSPATSPARGERSEGEGNAVNAIRRPISEIQGSHPTRGLGTEIGVEGENSVRFLSRVTKLVASAGAVSTAKRILGATCAVTAVSAGLLLTDASAEPRANAAVLCFEATCNYKDPQDTACALDAVTPQGGSLTVNGHNSYLKVEYRYSPLCRASWARATLLPGGDETPCWIQASGLKAFQQRSHSKTGEIFNSDFVPKSYNYCELVSETYMTGTYSDFLRKRACAQVTRAEGPRTSCTPWFNGTISG